MTNTAIQIEQTEHKPTRSETLIPPPLTLEQMLVQLEEAKGQTVKMDINGGILANDSETWDCLHQKSSGLTWEVKTTDGLRDKTNTYTWIEDKSNQGGMLSWFDNLQGKCTGNARCETSDYIVKVNQLKLCNFSDWRLPSKQELETILVMSKAPDQVKINKKFFPNSLASWYWTADTNINNNSYAWYVMFNNGNSLSDKKINPKHIRLVRGSP